MEFSSSGAHGINLYDLGAGVEVPWLAGYGGGGGYFSTQGEHGLFFYLDGGILGEHYDGGVGFSFPSFPGVCKNRRWWAICVNE